MIVTPFIEEVKDTELPNSHMVVKASLGPDFRFQFPNASSEKCGDAKFTCGCYS
jgi:hypothetical protein